MENLKKYLQDRNKGDFARKIGTSPSYLSQIMSAHRRPSLALMVRIEKATGGAVDLNSWSPTNAHSSEAAHLGDSLPSPKRENGVNDLQGQGGK
ncbi:MAG: helix-turn-helix domain-containing protein [Pikeienuella sp.]